MILAYSSTLGQFSPLDGFYKSQWAASELGTGYSNPAVYVLVALVAAGIGALATVWASRNQSKGPLAKSAFDGYTALVTALQTDNSLLRARVSELERHVKDLETKIDQLLKKGE